MTSEIALPVQDVANRNATSGETTNDTAEDRAAAPRDAASTVTAGRDAEDRDAAGRDSAPRDSATRDSATPGTVTSGAATSGAATSGAATSGSATSGSAQRAAVRPRAERRAELASFLRSRRERVRPEDVGLPPGPRRRTPGLRREEVAQLAGVGVTWYTWLEQGRRINASPQVLDAIARTLRLDHAEREHLYRLAEIPAVATAAGKVSVPDNVRQVLDGLVHLPASITNSRQDILAWNSAYAKVFPGIVSLPADKRNSLWVTFAYPGCCNPFVNRDERGPRLVAQFRAAYARHIGEPCWVELIEKLLHESAEFARLWQTHDVAGPGTQLKIMRNLAVGRLDMQTTSFEVHGVPEARMVVYMPLDERTERLIAELCEGPGGGTVCRTCGRPGR